MSRYTYLLFDLDGTLTDSQEGIINCFLQGLRAFDKTEADPLMLRRIIGPPLYNSYREYYGFSHEDATAAVAVYRVHYAQTGQFENRPYAGIPELLQSLKAGGYRLMVATSKPEYFANQILSHLGLAQYFELICGSDDDIGRSEKADVIREIKRVYPDMCRENALMIGDREYDVLGAAECGLDCVGVLYGFGDRDEHTAAGAKYIVETVADLGALLLD